jgi:hypothetical protein
MGAEQDSESAQRHTDGAESMWRMVMEKEVDVQTFDEQISEIHTAEHRAATISTTEMVHGRAREPPSQTWHASADKGRLKVLSIMVGVLAVAAQLKNVPGVVRMSLIGLIIWLTVVFLTRMAWMGSWFWKQDPKLYDITWGFEAIMSLWHLSAILTVLDHLPVYGRLLRAKIRVSELEVRYTVPEVKRGDGVVVILSELSQAQVDR